MVLEDDFGDDYLGRTRIGRRRTLDPEAPLRLLHARVPAAVKRQIELRAIELGVTPSRLVALLLAEAMSKQARRHIGRGGFTPIS